MRFELDVAPGGYAWWYLDALSEDGREGLTMIAFIGSVFSPYYAWGRRRDPYDHCALNVAFYRPRAGRWAMTERGRDQVEITQHRFQIGRSALQWDGAGLAVLVDETCAPIPYRLRGRILVRTEGLTEHGFELDEGGRHRWRPLAPSVDVELDFSEPALHWRGRGYLDANEGDEPLEEGFRFWHWSRAEIGTGETAVLYETEPRGQAPRQLALRFDAAGAFEPFRPPGALALPDTRIWRIRRPLLAERESGARVIRTFEDTPFYSRSLIENELFGAPRRAVHESFSGNRLRLPIVKALLPFRMPRLAG